MPLYDDPRVLLRTEETTHYNASYPESEEEWLAGFPAGTGTYRLKSHSDNRSVFTAMHHQLHCVQTLGKQLLHTNRPYWPHIQKCFNFLRQMALCRPDLTLEPGDFVKRNFTVQRMGALHVCRNWEHVRSTLTNDWEAWDATRPVVEG
ncbi:hypothetical protein BU17DRAFT_46394 [Hysterangium stoloniferum]|nr:hypothetical protein BU17DRAFT_46394 [Hysterangium stoloniferum]